MGGRNPRPPGSLERCYNRALAAIQLPPLSFPRRDPRQDPARPAKALTVLRHARLERRTPRPDHRRRGVNGYRSRLTSRNLFKFLARGQQPTDLNEPGRQSLPEFGCQSPRSHRLQRAAYFVRVRTEDLCRGWSVFRTLSLRSEALQVREEEQTPRRQETLEPPAPAKKQTLGKPGSGDSQRRTRWER